MTAPATKQRQSLLIETPAGRDLNAALSGSPWSESKNMISVSVEVEVIRLRILNLTQRVASLRDIQHYVL